MADPTTNIDESANNTLNKYVNSVVGGYQNVANLFRRASDNTVIENPDNPVSLPFGAQPRKPIPAIVNVQGISGNLDKTDLRVKIKVPNQYLETFSTAGYTSIRGDESSGNLKDIGGILFPYTPQINFDTKADYTSSAPTHSNYAIYFYQHSAVSAISITGKFTVQNDTDAINYLSTVNLLRALTKMHFGDDAEAGAPPPVCRLFAYGTYMFENVPVVITNFRIELPDSVDYYTMSKNYPDLVFGTNSIPISSSISVSCQPIYSRQEMQNFTVRELLNSKEFKEKGYL